HVPLLKKRRPGLLTGSADDYLSGIATYSQAGAQFGYGLLWSVLFTTPLMIGIQIVSARIGRVTGQGLAANVREHFPKAVLHAVVSLLLLANTINLAADLSAMGEALVLLAGGKSAIYIVFFALLSLTLQIFIPFPRYAPLLKWLTLALFALVGTVMMFSNVIALCIMLTTAATLHAAGVTDIQSSAQAAEALRPLAGAFAFALFAAGIIGTGLLAVPVLAGSAAYAVAETFRWPIGLGLTLAEARGFYAVLTVATVLGVLIVLSGID